MLREIVVPAPAKINMHLAVGGPRSDGFHSIASIFQAVSISDTVSVSIRDSGGITLNGDCDCAADKNTAYRAAAAFLVAAARAGSVPGVHIAIEKRIPIGAGLGGGSSDAASTLKALSRLFPGSVSRESIMEIAASVGSDVPFFMGTACAAVSGRGERLLSLPPRRDYALVIVDPGFPVSTKEAFGRLDEARARGAMVPCLPDSRIDDELAAIALAYSQEAPGAWPFRNDFYAALAPAMPGLAECRDALIAAGASFAALSGSGSAVFGVYSGAEEAARAAETISPRYTATVAFPLARLQESI